MKIFSAVLLGLFATHSMAAVKCNAERRHAAYRTKNAKECAHDKSRLKCLNVKEITDGDTLIVDIEGVHPYFGENASVRLFGLDTPESRPPSVECIKPASGDSELDREEYEVCKEAARLRRCEISASKEATSMLAEAICRDSDRVDIQIAKESNGKLIREKYGRILGNILIINKVSGRNRTTDARELLLKNQLAFAYDGGTKITRDWCGKTIVKEPKLQSSYVREHFCSSRKCTEKTRQVRCFRREGYEDQVSCYSKRISSNIGRWFNSCKSKSGTRRRSCYREKGEGYMAFCDLYKTSKEIKNCREDISETIGRYCSKLSGEAEKDCSLSASN